VITPAELRLLDHAAKDALILAQAEMIMLLQKQVEALTQHVAVLTKRVAELEAQLNLQPGGKLVGRPDRLQRGLTVALVVESHHVPPVEGLPRLVGRSARRRQRESDKAEPAYEGAQAGYCAASGLAAIAATIMQLCDSGDHVVASRSVRSNRRARSSDCPACIATTSSCRTTSLP
jgi:predicted nuclease with RNAse H fold